MEVLYARPPPIRPMDSWPALMRLHLGSGSDIICCGRTFAMRRFAFVMLLLVQGCASGGVHPLRPNEIATAPYRFGKARPLVGSLMYEGGCLLFRTEDDSAVLLPVWPTGTLFEESLVTFHEPGRADQRVAVGEEIRIDGLPLDWSSFDAVRYESFRHQCGAEPIFVAHVTPAN